MTITHEHATADVRFAETIRDHLDLAYETATTQGRPLPADAFTSEGHLKAGNLPQASGYAYAALLGLGVNIFDL
ncbi:hypothetical protein [Streptomyces sp. cg36]|uniref:hypothetical protein n=1 Tax=Streptomyces sp. cg36 TaxID=3238798 RepID=UPI0034E229A7